MMCAVCGLPCIVPPLCPGCSLAWRVAGAPCSQEGFEAWCATERKMLGCESDPPP